MTSGIERAEWLKGLAKDKEISDKLRIAFKHSDFPGKRNPTPDGTPYMPIPKPPPKV